MEDKNYSMFSAPVGGKIYPLRDSLDEVVAQGFLGRGILILPEDNIVYSPCHGQVVLVYPTKHAIIIKSDDGIAVLVHLGMNTAELNGEGFTVHVKDGDYIEQGQKLLEFDLAFLKDSKLSLLSPIVFPNLNDLDFMSVLHLGEAAANEPLVMICKKDD